MKTLILLLCLFLIGCSENPVINQQTDTRLYSDYISITIVSDYGYCDSSGCHGEAIILLSETKPVANLCYVSDFQTLPAYIVVNNDTLPYQKTSVMYDTRSQCYYKIPNVIKHSINGMGIDTMKLDFNKACQIFYGN